MVAVGHYLYAGEAVRGFNRILGTYHVRGDWAWSMGEGDVYGTSLWEIIKKGAYERRRKGEVG